MTSMTWIGHWPYFVTIALMMVGLYIVIARENLVKKMMGLNIFQVSVIMLYVAMGNVAGGTAPIIIEAAHDEASAERAPAVAASAVAPDVASTESGIRARPGVIYSNPLPHVLMLTAIVVGVATTALGLSFIVRIHESYGSSEEDDVLAADHAAEIGE